MFVKGRALPNSIRAASLLFVQLGVLELAGQTYTAH